MKLVLYTVFDFPVRLRTNAETEKFFGTLRPWELPSPLSFVRRLYQPEDACPKMTTSDKENGRNKTEEDVGCKRQDSGVVVGPRLYVAW